MIISGGENISTIEVEQALASHPAVLECAVVAIPHERWGERPKAFVTLRDGAEATAEELIEHCRSPHRALQGARRGRVRPAAEDLDRQGAEVRAARSRVGRSHDAHQLTCERSRAAVIAALVLLATGCLGQGGERRRRAAGCAPIETVLASVQQYPGARLVDRHEDGAARELQYETPATVEGAKVQLHFRRLLAARGWRCSFHEPAAGEEYGFSCRREGDSIGGSIADRGGYTLLVQVSGE